MTKDERLDEALRTMDFYELAKITYERSNPMKIKVKTDKEELCFLYNDVKMLKDVTEMVAKGNLSSPEAKAFNEGSNFAYKNVLKLIEERVTNERK